MQLTQRRCDEEIKNNKKKNIQIAFAPIFVTTAGGDLNFILTNNIT